jgi:hypothetical protein
MNIPEHYNSNMAGQREFWNGLDTSELYQKNLKERYEDLKQNGWIDKEIVYQFNSHGFRADEFDDSQNSVLSLGCSHTFGVGCNYENTWSYLISSALNCKNFNLAVGGSSNDTAFRLASYWIPKLKPKIVIFLSTEPTRFELHLADGDIENFSVWIKSDMQDQLYKHWMSNNMNSKFNFLKNYLAIKQICEDLGIKFFHEKYDNFKYFYIDLARDLQHFGAKTNQKFANKVLASL